MARLYEGTNYTLDNNSYKKVHASFLPTTPQPIIKKLNKCPKRHEMSPFTSMVRHDLIFLLFEACIFKKVT